MHKYFGVMTRDLRSGLPPVPNDTTSSIGTSGNKLLASWIATAVGLLAPIPPSQYSSPLYFT